MDRRGVEELLDALGAFRREAGAAAELVVCGGAGLLSPTADEMVAAARWTRSHDPSEGFLQCLRGALAHLGVDASHVE